MSQKLRNRNAGAEKGDKSAAVGTASGRRKHGEDSDEESEDNDADDSSKIFEYLSKHVNYRSLVVAITLSGLLAARPWVPALDSALQRNVLGNSVADYAASVLLMALIHISLYTVLHSLFKALRSMVAAHTSAALGSRSGSDSAFLRPGWIFWFLCMAHVHVDTLSVVCVGACGAGICCTVSTGHSFCFCLCFCGFMVLVFFVSLCCCCCFYFVCVFGLFCCEGIALHMMLAALKHETRPARSYGFSMEHAANLIITA